MTPQLLCCPHCSMQVHDDRSLSGQVVKCPRCGKPFIMPVAQIATTAVEVYEPRYIQPRKRKTGSFFVVGVIVLTAFAIGGAVAFVVLKHEAIRTIVRPEVAGKPAEQKLQAKRELTQEEATSALQAALDAWLFKVPNKEFKRTHPEIDLIDVNEVEAILHVPQKYDISGCREFVFDGKKAFEFRATLTYQSVSGPGVAKAAEYKVLRSKDSGRLSVIGSEAAAQ